MAAALVILPAWMVADVAPEGMNLGGIMDTRAEQTYRSESTIYSF